MIWRIPTPTREDRACRPKRWCCLRHGSPIGKTTDVRIFLSIYNDRFCYFLFLYVCKVFICSTPYTTNRETNRPIKTSCKINQWNSGKCQINYRRNKHEMTERKCRHMRRELPPEMADHFRLWPATSRPVPDHWRIGPRRLLRNLNWILIRDAGCFGSKRLF